MLLIVPGVANLLEAAGPLSELISWWIAARHIPWHFHGRWMPTREASELGEPIVAGQKIRFASGLYDRFLPLYTKEVVPEGIDLEFTVIDNPREIFDRMAGGLEFDACEMSGTEYISRFAADDCPFVAIPVFASRMFRHGFIVINKRSGITTPKDLEGRRLGVQLYTMSAAMWIRGMLRHEYGVDLSTIRWVQGAMDRADTHGTPTVLPLLKQPNVENNTTGRSLSQLLEDGAIDAVLSASLPTGLGTHPDIARLFPDFRAVETDYYQRTKIHPIMHMIVIRKDVYAANPHVAPALYEAFSKAKDIALQRMRYSGALRYMLPFLQDDVDEIDRVFDGDPWPYGLAPNRPTLEAEVQYMVEQDYMLSSIPIEQLFVAGVA
jgi:4,5-dihydroxyphthalate decarboxylase